MTDARAALVATHEALAAAHAAFLEAMASSHAAFLQTAERGVHILAETAGTTVVSTDSSPQHAVEVLPAWNDVELATGPSQVSRATAVVRPVHASVPPLSVPGSPLSTGMPSPPGRQPSATEAAATRDTAVAPIDPSASLATGTLPQSLPSGQPPGASEVHLDIEVSRHTHPNLVDHSIRGVPVVPVVYTVEWAVRAARMAAPGMSLESLRNVKVLKGIRAEGWAGGRSLHLEVVAKPSEEGEDSATLMIEVRSPAGVHYRCLAGMAVNPMLLPPLEVPAVNREPWRGELYGGVLFHGPAFQMIDSIDALTETSFAATVRGVRDMRWPDEPWQTDPVAFDAGLQMAVLWTEHLLGAASLPTSIGDVVVHRPPASGILHATLMARDQGKSRVRCDVAFLDATGVLVAELRDVETHLLPPVS